IIMVNLPPLNNDPNVPEDEHASAPEHAPIAPNPAPIQPNDYLAEEDEDTKVKDNEDENDANIIQPYEEVNPLNRPPPSPETAEKEFMNAPVSQSTLQPLPHIWVESSSSKRLEKNDMRMDSFKGDLTALDSTLREQIQEMKRFMAELNERFQQIQERDLRAKNEMVRIRLRAAEEKAEYYKNHFSCMSRYYNDLSGWEYIIRNKLPLKRRYRERPYDPSTNTTSRP
nr:hypothetical protein [Tanacetum cinerariifolium]